MKLRVTASSLRVRSSPDVLAPIVATLSKGDEVESAETPWRLVRTSGGVVGWVSASHVTEATQDALVRLSCPFCRHSFDAVSVGAVATCPNPSRLPGDTAEQRAAGGRLCRASFRYVSPHVL